MLEREVKRKSLNSDEQGMCSGKPMSWQKREEPQQHENKSKHESQLLEKGKKDVTDTLN
jgi:hypothetical protein